MLAEGSAVPELCKTLEVSEQTYHRWRAQYGGMKADDIKRLKELERENVQLKRLALREISKAKLVSPSRRRAAVLMLEDRLGLSQRRACQIAVSTDPPSGVSRVSP